MTGQPAGAPPAPPREDPGRLRLVKLLHSTVWAFFVASILGVWAGALLGRHDVAFTCVAIVVVEVIILLVNGWACPLTAIAARYTADRRPNFDIYLPEWLARYNKEVFGTLYVAGVLYAVARWRGWV